MSSEDMTHGGRGVNRRSVLKSVSAAGLVGLGVGGVRGRQRGRGKGRASSPSIRGSVRQVVVTNATPGSTVTLYAKGKDEVAEATADDFGSYIFRDVEPGPGYKVSETVDGSESPLSKAVRVLNEDYTPPYGFYRRQKLEEGYGYFEVRDGTKLSYQVSFPDSEEWGDPPYPVIIDYSGYKPALEFWDDIDTYFNSLGYAVAGVNMRGSGCSGGKFDFFEPLQLYDGYDMVEVIAAQDWSDGVGLAGKSYPGYSQLFVAATQPPSLDAIAPGHPVGEFYRDVAYPGGIQNAVFAVNWSTDRDRDTAPGPYGEGDPVYDQIEGEGDEICEANQQLRLQNPNLQERVLTNPFYTSYWRDRAPWDLVDQIEVPTMLVTSWQDEQVGSRPTRLLEEFSDDIPVRFVGSNGDHYEYFDDYGEYPGAEVFDDVSRFFAYYLKEEVPPEDADKGSFDAALAAYEDEGPVQIYWEVDQDHTPRYESTYSEWPPAETWNLYFQPDASLGESPPDAEQSSSSYSYEPRPPLQQLVPRDDDDRLQWPPQPEGTYVSFVTNPLEEDHVLLGSASVELWLASTASDTDVEVTLSEIRPDGSEMYVQNGWLRASRRHEDSERSKPRRPWHTHQPEDAQPLPGDEFDKMRVEVFPFGHVFREGSRLKVAIETPGGNRSLWGFNVVQEPATNRVAHSSSMPSNVALPLVPSEEAGVPEPPACGSVRNQPCRIGTFE